MPSQLNRIAVFCGSNPGADPSYVKAAVSLARAFAKQNIGLVYGGADVGIMKAIANAMLAENKEVIGVIPQALVDLEIAKTSITEIHIVKTMHERKAKLSELADGFILLPGGFGSLDEFFESLTWGQLGFHNKPCGILNTNGYYNKLLEFLNHGVEQRFLKKAHKEMISIAQQPEKLITLMQAYQPSFIGKWVTENARIEEFEL